MRASKLATLPIIALMAASCSMLPKDGEIKSAVVGATKEPGEWAADAEKYGDPSVKWLTSFNDPMLLKLIKEGKANNLDLQVAAGSMDRAWLLAERAGAALKPTADITMGGGGSGNVSGGSQVTSM